MKRLTERKSGGNPFNRRFLCVAALVLLAFASSAAALMSVVDSKHNLSISGPGTMKATAESEICIFCHTPHGAEPGGVLWNRADPAGPYQTYDSTTIQTFVGQPTKASRKCLSCHDGTIALGQVSSRPAQIPMSQQFLNTGPAFLDTDLRDDHPISLNYGSAPTPEYKNPATLTGPVKLDKDDDLQCTACHDPHDDTLGDFLTDTTFQSALCLNCHQPTGWTTGTHRNSAAGWNGSPPDPWPHTDYTSVAENACENCHRPHSAGRDPHILNEFLEEDNCYPCHNGNLVGAINNFDIQSEFVKPSNHPIGSTVGTHEPTEDYLTMARHVECADCHNPHQANDTPANAPLVSGALLGVKGVDAAGGVVDPSINEYEICFNCHADSAPGPIPIPRQIPEVNKRQQFALSNPSYHPVEGPGKNANVPSLAGMTLNGVPLTTGTVIYCTDCHNNNNGPGGGGGGPNGPHGSTYDYLLERRNETADFTPESSTNYALCYKCHNRNSILNDDSFDEHDKHIRGEDAPCSVCHDPHGVDGTASNNTHLINFDTSVVFPSGGQLWFRDDGVFGGTCRLVCHGEDHNPFNYP